MKYIGPILYKGKLSVDKRGIDLNTKILLHEGALVFTHKETGAWPVRVGKIDWIWDHGDEMWAALDLEGTPPMEDDLFPQVDVSHAGINFERRGDEMWFTGELTIIGCNLGKHPMWPDLPPVKPS